MKLAKFSAFFAPHKTIPHTSWRAAHRWDLSPARVAILFFGLAIFGLGDALLIQSNIGIMLKRKDSMSTD
jgi:hypothetical protein